MHFQTKAKTVQAFLCDCISKDSSKIQLRPPLNVRLPYTFFITFVFFYVSYTVQNFCGFTVTKYYKSVDGSSTTYLRFFKPVVSEGKSELGIQFSDRNFFYGWPASKEFEFQICLGLFDDDLF